MCCSERFTYKVLHRYLKGLVLTSGHKKIHVIMDNHPVHHSRIIKRWARALSKKIELHFLLSYSPDLNPDEYFNCDLKTELAKRPERGTKVQWEDTVRSTLTNLEQQPERIASYFTSKNIKYTA